MVLVLGSDLVSWVLYCLVRYLIVMMVWVWVFVLFLSLFVFSSVLMEFFFVDLMKL